MGLITRVLGAGDAVRGVGNAVGGVAEVFVGNRAERDAAQTQAYLAAVAQHGAEFAVAREGRFDRFMDGLNRLPRPLLVIGTLGMMVHAMVAPESFARRMEGLALVPEPLWWLLGAIVSFYFGSRELYYQRSRNEPRILLPEPLALPERKAKVAVEPEPETKGEIAPKSEPPPQTPPAAQATPGRTPARPRVAVRAADPEFNAAVEEWRQTRG